MKVVSIMEDLIVQATSGHSDRPTGNCPIRFGTVNVGMMMILSELPTAAVSQSMYQSVSVKDLC